MWHQVRGYVLSASAKGYSFIPRYYNVTDEIVDLDLIASP